MGSSNISINVTADATQARAQMLLVQAELRALTREGAKTATSMRELGGGTAEQAVKLEQLASQINTAKSQIAGLATKLGEGRQAIEGVARAEANSGAATEGMILVHEALRGNFSRMAGSAMILSSRIQGLGLAFQGLVGAMAVATLGAFHFWEYLKKINETKLMAEAGGLGSGIPMDKLDALADKLRAIPDVATKEAGQAANVLARLPGASIDTMNQLADDLRAAMVRGGEGASGAAQKIAEAWNLNARAGVELLNEARSSAGAVAAFNKAIADNDPVAARITLIRELTRSERELQTETRAKADYVTQADLARERARQGMAFASPGAPMPRAARVMIERAQAKDSAGAAQEENSAISGITAATAAAEPPDLSQQWHTQLAKLTLATEQAGVSQKESWQKIHQAMAQTEVDFWQKTLDSTKAGTKAHEDAERSLYAAKEQLAAYSYRADIQSARQGLEAKLATLSEEQAANRDSFAKVMQLENEKLHLLEAAGSAYTAKYQEELKRRDELLRQHTRQIVQQEMEAAHSAASQDRAAFAERKALLDQEVATFRMSKQQEAAALQDLGRKQYEAELDALTKALEVDGISAADFKRVMDEKLRLTAEYNARMQALTAASVRQQSRDWQESLRPVQNAFDGLFRNMLSGRMTVGQAMARAAQQWAQEEVSQVVHALGQKLIAYATEKAAFLLGETEKQAAQATTSDMGIATLVVDALKAIAIDASKVFAGVFSFLAPVLGPAAAGPAMASEAVVTAAGSSIAAFAVGAWELPADMPGMLHAGEMIIPATFAAGLRGAMSGGGAASGGIGDTYNITVSAVDAQSVQSFINKNARLFAAAVSGQMSRNPTLRPTF